jgi:hypothetical protein
MAVRVARARRRDGDPGSGGRHERLGRRRPAAVVRDLEEIDRRQARDDDVAIHVLLDVPGQQEPARPDRAEHHDRDVVDAGPGIRWLGRDPPADRPQHPDRDLVDGQSIARGDGAARGCPGSTEGVQPGRVPGTRSAHARLEDASDPVA